MSKRKLNPIYTLHNRFYEGFVYENSDGFFCDDVDTTKVKKNWGGYEPADDWSNHLPAEFLSLDDIPEEFLDKEVHIRYEIEIEVE